MPEPTTPPSGSGEGDDGQGSGGSGGSTPPVADPKEKKLSDENAKLRIRLRSIKEVLGTDDLDEIKTKFSRGSSGSPSGDGDGEGDRGTLSKLERENKNLRADLEGLKKQVQTREDKGREKFKRATVTEAVTRAGVLEDAKDDVIALLSQRAKVNEDDSVTVTITDENGEEREIELTAEAITKHKLVKPYYFPAEGGSGSGGRGPATTKGGLDFQKILADPKLYEKHRAEIMQARREGRL
jgi:hypothetical protein